MRILCLILCAVSSPLSQAEVHSEIIFFLQPDGKNYLLERSIHTDSNTHRFHLDKSIQLGDILHISPARFAWDDKSNDQLNSINFDAGGFTLIYPDSFNDDQLLIKSNGVYQYRSWDGKKDASGRYGYWYHPEPFSHFTYTWILPENIKLLSYHSNRQGSWTSKDNAVSFYTENKNNITFEMSYQVNLVGTGTTDCVVPPAPKPAPPQACTQVKKVKAQPQNKPNMPAFAEHKDSDNDSITDHLDLCPNTPTGARIDQAGCPLDNDYDGVPDGIDQCIASKEGEPVSANGCAG